MAPLFSALAAAAANAELRIYRPAHRPAAELLPLAETALAGEGSAVLDSGTNSLVLMGEEPALTRTLELLERQDRALRNVVLRYESRTAADFETAGVAIDWRVVAGDVRIGTIPGPESASVLAVRPEAATGTSGRRFEGTLRILEGNRGQLLAGTEVPVTTRERSPWGVRESTAFVAANSGFEVTPHVLGDGRVRLDIETFSGRLAPGLGSGPAVERSGAASQVMVAPGESVVLGQLAADQTTRELGVRGATRARSHEDTLLLVRVELE